MSSGMIRTYRGLIRSLFPYASFVMYRFVLEHQGIDDVIGKCVPLLYSS